MLTFTVALVALVLLWGATSAQASTGCTQPTSTTNGYCAIYPADGLCAEHFAGKSVWIPENVTTSGYDRVAEGILALLQKNSDQVTPQCLIATSKWTCSNYFPPCITIDNVAFPQLACESQCLNYWDECRTGLDLYLLSILYYTPIPISQNNLVHCGTTGTWASLPQPPDVFGVRNIPVQPIWHEGYRGNLRYPVSAGIFHLPNGTNVSVPCTTMPTFTSAITIDSTDCAYPLIPFENNSDVTCVLPCPFPVIPASDLQAIDWAFVIPGLVGIIFSVIVCLDTTWVMFDSTHGFGCYDRVRMMWGKQSMGSRNEGSTTDQVLSGGNESSSTASRFRRTKIRSSMVYALLGSILSIIYFLIGPLLTLLKFEKISCGGKDTFDVSDLIDGTQPMGDSMCQAQRVAPFVLQGIFNLMLYALFRVLLMVDQKFKQWSTVQLLRMRLLAMSYCGLGPFVTMGIALGLDKTTDDITLLFGQLARNSAICTMRLTNVQEFILVFLPFILTGCMVTAVSLYIWSRLSSIQAGVKELRSGKSKSSDIALRNLMMRLSVLGVATFIVILILLASTGYLIRAMDTFSPRFFAWFACETTSATCVISQGQCADLKTSAYDASPAYGAFGVQIAAMSCISLLLSGFFAAQAVPRLFHEWYTGDLSQKMDNILEGRPLHYNVGTKFNSSANADVVKMGGFPNSGESTTNKNNRVAPGSIQLHADREVAAYMVSSVNGDFASPIYENEVTSARDSRRVADSSD